MKKARLMLNFTILFALLIGIFIFTSEIPPIVKWLSVGALATIVAVCVVLLNKLK